MTSPRMRQEIRELGAIEAAKRRKAAPGVKVWFVIWPDGKMFEKTQTSISESHAIEVAIRIFLPDRFFPELDMGTLGYGIVATMWRSMQKAGFKCHCIEVNATGIMM